MILNTHDFGICISCVYTVHMQLDKAGAETVSEGFLVLHHHPLLSLSTDTIFLTSTGITSQRLFQLSYQPRKKQMCENEDIINIAFYLTCY